jgi:hypothetical protein
MGSPELRKPERTMAERIRFRQDRSADFPQKEHAGIRGDSVQWQMPGQAIPPFNKRIEGPTDGRLPHPRAIEMGGPLVIGHDGRRSRRFPIFWPETAARRTAP